MNDALIICTKGIIQGGDISVPTKGFISSKASYWFGQLWRELISLYSTITKTLSMDSKID